MKPRDTPRTNALLTELSIFKEATFEYIVSQTQRHADFTRSLERENNLLMARIYALEMIEVAARKAVRVRGNGQPKQMDDAVLMMEALFKGGGAGHAAVPPAPTTENEMLDTDDLRYHTEVGTGYPERADDGMPKVRL